MTALDQLDLRSWHRVLLATTCLVFAGAAPMSPVDAAPSGLSVGAGQITVSTPNAQTTLVQQGTNSAILNWNSFSIAHGESVIFQQPNSSSVALNRVTGGQASSIFGNLTANGHVWLLNPNGILFGAGAVVNVASLIATTSGIRDSDFLAGNYNFGIPSPNPNAGVVNQGTIQAATGGSVVLSGAYVRNDGLIQANLGTVVLAGATTFAVDFTGDKLLSYAVTGPVTQTPVDQNGNPVTALVNNTGSIGANGGQVLLTARAANNILDNVINTTGIVEANTASMVNGTVVLDAGTGGVTVGGQISATGLNAGETGGTIKVLGGAVTIGSGAAISASGDAGGGAIDIGGDFHGAGPDANAWTTEVQQGAMITADAITTGNGGNVAVWADGYTAFNGTISAQGGALSGDGGFVETSGHQGLLALTGTVNTRALNGHYGTWLLDPLNITIVSSGGANSLAQESSFTSDAGLSDTINASLISGATSNVLLEATNNITWNAFTSVTTSGVGITARAGNDIAVNSVINTTGGNIVLSANDNTGGTATGSGSITIASAGANIETNASGGTGGSITMTTNGGTGSINTGSAPIQTTNGAVNISGGSGTNSDVNTNNGIGITLGNGSGSITTTGTAGTVSLTSAGSISITSGVGIQTTGGSVTVSANDSSAGTPTGSGSITFSNLGISTTGKSGTTVSMTNGSSTITLLNSDPFTQGFSTGQTIAGVGIPSGTTIASMSGSTITLSNAVTTTASDVFVRAIGGSTSTGGAITLKTNGGSGAISLGTAGLLTAGGDITLSAASVTGSTNGPGISSAGSNASGAASAAGGNVSITTTVGGVTLGGGIITSGGFNSSGIGGNSGGVTISSAGAVDIGGGLSLITSGSGTSLSASVQSIGTGAASASNTSQTTGNGGAISVTGTSIKLELGATSNGGNDQVAGSTSNGGNAGSIMLDATSGIVTLGSDSTGSLGGLSARGGDSIGGSGGAGANISVTGTAITVGGRLSARGGDTFASNGVSGGNAGSITLTATGTDGSGHSIQLYGESDPVTDTDPTTTNSSLSARGGEVGITQEFTDTGTVTGRGGNITLQNSGGGTLQGDVVLQTSTASSLNGGSAVVVSVGGGTAGTGGALTIQGAVDAATANVESLRLSSGNGSATVAGAVGSGTALNSVVLGSGISNLSSGTGGSITFQGPVTVGTQIQDLRSSGSLTFNGQINTPSLKIPDSSSVSLAMNGGAVFSGDIKTNTNNSITLGGNFVFTSSFTGNLSGGFSPSFVLSKSGSFDTSALNIPVIVSSITGNNFSLGLNVGSGSFTVGSISNVRLSLGGSGTYTFNNASGLSYDFSRFSGKATANGTTVFPIPASNLAPLIPRIVSPIVSPPITVVAPQPIQVPISVVPLTPVVTVAPTPTTGVIAAPSDNAPTTVQGTDTGGSMFSQISSSGAAPATPGSSSGTNGTSGTGSTSGTSSSDTGSTAGTGDTASTGGTSSTTSGSSSTSGTSNTSGTSGGSTSGAASSTGQRTPTASGAPATPGSPASASPVPPPDSGDRTLSVVASPPPVQPVSHALPSPPRVTTTVVPGFINQVQKPPVPKSGTPGIQQNYSASGNVGRWSQ